MNLDLALESFRRENEGQDAEIVTIRIQEPISIESRWTDRMWDDGVPHVKFFYRNPLITIQLMQGDVIRGIAFKGGSSGKKCLSFYHRGVWYSLDGKVAVRLLKNKEK